MRWDSEASDGLGLDGAGSGDEGRTDETSKVLVDDRLLFFCLELCDGKDLAADAGIAIDKVIRAGLAIEKEAAVSTSVRGPSSLVVVEGATDLGDLVTEREGSVADGDVDTDVAMQVVVADLLGLDLDVLREDVRVAD